jgi:hypothetical protein
MVQLETARKEAAARQAAQERAAAVQATQRAKVARMVLHRLKSKTLVVCMGTSMHARVRGKTRMLLTIRVSHHHASSHSYVAHAVIGCDAGCC